MNKIALVTGASQGLGYEFARILAQNKFDLILVARNLESLNEVKKELEKEFGVAVKVIVQDLSDPSAGEKIHKQIGGAEVEILINNAGFATHGPFIQIPLKDDIEEIAVNIVSLTSLTKLISSDMVKRKSGRILNVASTAAFQPGPLMAVYYATKSYVLSFSQALSYELRGSGVTVTALCPGPIHTGFEKRAHMQGSTLFKSAMMPQDVAAIGYRAMMGGRRVVVAGYLNWLGTIMVRLAPQGIVMSVIEKIQK